jgi:hypothetical protein
LARRFEKGFSVNDHHVREVAALGLARFGTRNAKGDVLLVAAKLQVDRLIQLGEVGRRFTPIAIGPELARRVEAIAADRAKAAQERKAAALLARAENRVAQRHTMGSNFVTDSLVDEVLRELRSVAARHMHQEGQPPSLGHGIGGHDLDW